MITQGFYCSMFPRDIFHADGCVYKKLNKCHYESKTKECDQHEFVMLTRTDYERCMSLNEKFEFERDKNVEAADEISRLRLALRRIAHDNDNGRRVDYCDHADIAESALADGGGR